MRIVGYKNADFKFGSQDHRDIEIIVKLQAYLWCLV